MSDFVDKLSEIIIKVIDKIDEKLIEKVFERVLEKSIEKALLKIKEGEVEYKVEDKVEDKVEELYKLYNLSSYPYPVNEWDIPLKLEDNRFNLRHPIVINSDFNIGPGESYFIVDNKKTPTYVTLPTTSISIWSNEYIRDKEIVIKNLHNQPIFSRYNDVKQLDSEEISNCILPASNKNKYVRLKTNGENWYIESIFEKDDKKEQKAKKIEDEEEEKELYPFSREWGFPLKHDVHFFNLRKPIVINSDFIIGPGESYFMIKNDKKTSTYITLPTTSISILEDEYIRDKEIVIKSLDDKPIFSRYNDVKQLDSEEISNCILPASNKNKYVRLKTNGENWYIESIFERVGKKEQKAKINKEKEQKEKKVEKLKKDNHSKKTCVNNLDILSNPNKLSFNENAILNKYKILEYPLCNDIPNPYVSFKEIR